MAVAGSEDPPPPGRRLLVDAACMAVVLGVAAALLARVIGLFPQAEFIDQLEFPAGAILRDSIEAMVTFRSDAFSRHVPLIFVSATGRVCGTDITCINTLAFLPIAVTAAGLYVLGRMLRLPAFAALGVVLVLLVSEPTFSFLSWQATIFDRLAALFTVGVLVAVVALARRDQMSGPVAVLWSVVLTAACLVGANTKEPAWVLIPLLVLAPLLVARDREHALRAAKLLAAPVLVLIVNVATTLLAISDDPVFSAHVGNGSVADNLPLLTRYAVPGGLSVVVPAAVVSLVLIALAWRGRREHPAAAELARYAAWIGVSAVLSWVIPLRTEYPSAFYMFLPLGLLALAVALAVRSGQLLLADRWGARAGYVAAGAAALLMASCLFVAATQRYDWYDGFFEGNDNFRDSLDEIAAVRAASPGAYVAFNTAPETYLAFHFVSANPAANFWRFAGKPQPIDRTYGSATTPTACGSGGTVVIVLDAQMRFVRACPARRGITAP